MQETNEKYIGSDPQNIAEEQEENEGKGESKNEIKNGGGSLFIDCMKLWTLFFVKALVIVTPVLVVLWIFFLPALVLKADGLQDLKDLIYVNIQTGFRYVANYGFTSIYGTCVFGFYFTKKALLFCILPGLISSIFIDFIFPGYIGILIYYIGLFSSILLVYQQKLPENPSEKVIEEFERKYEIAKSLGRMALVLVVVIIIFRFIYPIFLNSDFHSKVLIRFVVLPIMAVCCSSLQIHFLKSVQKKHIDFLIPMLWITNGYLKMYERIFTNSMFNSGDYISLIVTTFIAALIEIVNHTTYFYRYAIVRKIKGTLSELRKGKNRSVHTTSLVPSGESQSQDEIQKHDYKDEHEWILDLRKRLVIEEIPTEMMMIFTVTFLLYFVHPLVENEKAQTISRFEVCIIQLLIQIAFELLSDVFGIYWTIRRHKIEMKTSDVKIRNRWFWVWIFFILFQLLQFFWFLLSY
eukprot:TRINITY_DN9666_c0_g1_i1.p1 TRINITY_DN9666_c0_g1~~TRINITY_DN9666_c0_g1_i1.p1  ORF type:complete len:464 (-),score=93.27 TRINITY_DN9666_c0_g1_i1:277-1668(-)